MTYSVKLSVTITISFHWKQKQIRGLVGDIFDDLFDDIFDEIFVDLLIVIS